MGIIFDIKRFAVHDGPGIRTTVFMKGCPLSCHWCHNPESISSQICTVHKTIKLGNKLFTENEVVGREISVNELMKELLKEKIFMDESGGGVTFSGGEPLWQHEFLSDALVACKNAGMHTTVDSSGFASWKILSKIAMNTDLFLFDLKIIDDTLHKKFTGVSNIIILKNLEKLLTIGKAIRIRMPMIPDVSFTENNINQTIHYLLKLKYPIEGVDLLAYHTIASHKYERFDIKNHFDTKKSVNKSDLEKVKIKFEKAGFEVKIGG